MNLLDLLDFSLRSRPDAIGLEYGDDTYTFGQIESRSNRLAQFLIGKGFEPGDRLCVYLANCVGMIDLYLACVKAGIIFVPINILYREREISHILRDAEPRAIVSDDPSLSAWTRNDLHTGMQTSSDVRPAVRVAQDAAAGIIYTSGTTGTSKGALLSHANFAANAANLLSAWRFTSQDRLLLALPLFHVHGLGNGLHCWLASGCRMRLLDRFIHQTIRDTFLDFRPTVFFGVPTMYVRLLDFDIASAREIGAFMRLFVSGSAPLPAAVLEQFRELFGHTILERYGMSETLMIMSNPYEGERRPGTVGLPLPGVSVRLLDDEIYLRGPNVFSGYWRREDATRDAFVDGFFRTGDLATRSADGYYTLCGRKSDVIISGGFNVYPREIEEFLQTLPEIAEAAVIGVPDPLRGEVPVAYVVPRKKFDEAAIVARCRDALASFKIPRKLVTIDKLPRNALGKIQKHLL
jgi:malonyl-CoA/methylmalonyl-CoA synthetase